MFGSGAPIESLDAAAVFDALQGELFDSQSKPVSLDRYQIHERLGRGGCGVVYRGFDPQLQRDVAIKLISIRGDSATASVRALERRRLLREARALAAVSHPNIVAVYALGTDARTDDSVGWMARSGDCVFIVMELIDGPTLSQWLQASPRSPREILGCFIEAAKGLAAAHDAGLVHGDFKPSNVMIGSDGRLRVLDFGLARARQRPAGERLSTPNTAESSSLLEVTDLKVVMGTPAYMSPEQHRGEPLQGASDQYSFCVALYAALRGRHPFSASSLQDLLDQKEANEIRSVPRRSALSGSLQRLLWRGLRADPAKRHPSMDVVVDELRRAQRRLERRRWIPPALVSALGLTTALGQLPAAVDAERCSGAASQLEDVWDDARRAQVKTAMLQVHGDYAPVAWKTTSRALDGFAQQWTEMYVQTCEAASVRDEMTPAEMDLRMACLHRAKVRLHAVTRVLTEADPEVVQNSGRLVGGLPALTQCDDIEALEAPLAPPSPHEAAAVEDVRVALADARSERHAGRYAAAQATLDAAKEQLRTIEYEPVHVQALLEQGHTLEALGRYQESAETLREALWAATRSNHRPAMLESAVSLILVLGSRLGSVDEGLQYAKGALELAKGDALATADVHNNVGVALRQRGSYEEAEREHRRALALRIEARGPEDLSVVQSRVNLAVVLAIQGRREEAEAEFRAVVALREAILGATHPEVADALQNLGAVLHLQGRYQEAERVIRETLEVRVASLDADHPDILRTRTNLGSALSAQGNFAEAEAHQREALDGMLRVMGDEHPSVGIVRHQLASTLYSQDRFAEAEEQYRLAQRQIEKTLGAAHPDLVMTRTNIAHCLQARGEVAEAEEEYRQALALAEASLADDHPTIALAHHGLATLLFEQDRPGDALTFAELAWNTRQRSDIPAGHRADTAFLLARVLLRAEPTQAARAAAIAELARQAYAEAGDDAGDREVQAWIEAIPGRL